MPLLSRLAAFKSFRVLLVGDFMLDQHVYGAAERLSPDAPVPVLQATRFEDRPGGASNVALCLRALEGEVICCGILGADREGTTLCSALSEAECDVEGLIKDPSRPTTIKRSLIGLAQHRHPQKMFRLDFESREPMSDAIRDALLASIASRLPEVDVVCLEDYNKCVCDEVVCRRVIEWCRAHGTPVVVDPAAVADFSKYRGATAITPNRSEAELATGLGTPIDATDLHNAGLARKLLEDLELDAVVLTLDRHGALLEERGGETVLVPTVARSVYDVTGAGDVVLAALTASVANKLSWHDAVRVANAAAGLEVESFGIRPISLTEVRREILRLSRPLEGKVRTREELVVELDVHREAGHRIVLTNGCFDVVHAGHVSYLRESKQLGDVLVVAVNGDEQVRAQKGDGRPVYDLRERLEILGVFECIDYLVVFDEPTAHDVIRAVRPDVYVKGGDYDRDDVNEIDLLDEMGVDVQILAHRPGLASTPVIERFVRAYGGGS